jgi:DNA-binding MltR family transcriptional regulator
MWLTVDADEIAAINELETATDRAVGIVVGSIVESRLTDIIKRCFVQNPAKIKGEPVEKLMFQSSGPIGAFASKIRLAYLIGLIGEQFFRELETMKNIRNEFAHHLEIGSFDVLSVKDKCANLKLIEKIAVDPDLRKPLNDSFPRVPLTISMHNVVERLAKPRERYLMTGQAFALVLGPGHPARPPMMPPWL